MWASNVTFPHCSGEYLLCWVKVAAATFHSQPEGLQFPREYLVRPEQHHPELCSQLKSICSEQPKEVIDTQFLSLGFISTAQRLQTAGSFSGYGLGICFISTSVGIKLLSVRI